MKYPLRLVPKANYTLINPEKIATQGYLLRSTPDGNIVDKETGKLRIKYIANPTENLTDYSTNLLGRFRLEDRGLKVLSKELNVDWSPGTMGLIPETSEFIYDNERGYFLLNVGQFQLHKFTYQLPDGTSVSATCRVVHTPTVSNFWHFSVRWFNENEQEVSGLTKGMRRRVLNAAKTLIQNNAVFKLDTVPELHSDVYT